MFGHRLAVVAILYSLIGLPCVDAQGTTGVVSGMVSDPVAAAVGGVTVVARHTQTEVRYEAPTVLT